MTQTFPSWGDLVRFPLWFHVFMIFEKRLQMQPERVRVYLPCLKQCLTFCLSAGLEFLREITMDILACHVLATA